MKKFEPHYRLVRYGQASKIEKPSRQQRTSRFATIGRRWRGASTEDCGLTLSYRQATQEPHEGVPGYCQGEGRGKEEGQIDACSRSGWSRWLALVLRSCTLRWSIHSHDVARTKCQHGVSGRGVTRRINFSTSAALQAAIGDHAHMPSWVSAEKAFV